MASTPHNTRLPTIEEAELPQNESDQIANASTAIERSIWRPSNVHVKDSADNLKKVITGKSNDKKRGPLPENVQPTQKKALVDSQAIRMSTPPSQGIVEGLRPTEKPIHHRKMQAALPPPPSNRPLPKPVVQPRKHRGGKQMIQALQVLLAASSEMQPPAFKFEASDEAASYNFHLLQRHNFLLEDLLNDPNNSVTAYGSEFKSIDLIEGLLGGHHRWPALKSRLE